jgi:hypothetical protein
LQKAKHSVRLIQRLLYPNSGLPILSLVIRQNHDGSPGFRPAFFLNVLSSVQQRMSDASSAVEALRLDDAV